MNFESPGTKVLNNVVTAFLSGPEGLSLEPPLGVTLGSLLETQTPLTGSKQEEAVSWLISATAKFL